MILKIESEDGQDFAVLVGEGSGCIKIAVSDCNKYIPQFEPFTVEEAQAAVSLLQHAIAIAQQERAEVEAEGGY